MKKQWILALSLTSVLSGCVITVSDHDGDSSWKRTQRDNREIISDLALGSTITTVKEKMGAPEFIDSFKQDSNIVKVLYYRTQHRHSDGETTRDETTPLVFINDELHGIGKAAYSRVLDNN